MKDKEEVKKKTKTTKKVAEKKETKEKEKKVVKAVKEKPVVEKKETKKKEKKLDEKKEVKQIKEKETVLLDTTSQKYLKTLSKVISVFAKIGRILLMIAVPFIFICMIAIPFVAKHLEINGNVVRFYDSSLTVNNGYVTFKYSDNEYTTSEDYNELSAIGDFLTRNTKGDIILITEVSLGFAGALVVIAIYLLIYIEKLFKNISEQDTPFTNENANYIRRIGHTMIIGAIVSFIFEVLIGIFVPKAQLNGLESYSVFRILIVFVIYFVFKYATNLQNKTEYKIYK